MLLTSARLAAASSVSLFCLTITSSAFAQNAEPLPPPPPPPQVIAPSPVPAPYDPGPPPPESGPAAARGFQLAFRTGWAMPMGKLATGADLSNTYGGQVPLHLELGGKLSRNVLLGGYIGLGIGGTGTGFDDVCRVGDCAAATFRFGAQIQYHFAPGAKLNPWLGYGIGIESSRAGSELNGNEFSTGQVGWEFGRFTLGVDYRVDKSFGIGPYADLAIGQYNRTSTKLNNIETESSINDRALHSWLTVGVRFVLFP